MSLRTFKNAAVLSVGSALGQVVGLAALPFLARLYSPESFGVFGTYVAAVAIGGLVATLKLDVALIKADTEQDAASLFWAGCVAAASSGLLCLAAILIWSMAGPVPAWTYAIPPSVFLFAVLQLSYGYCNRQQKYGSMAFRKGANAILTVSFQLAIALFTDFQSGLVIGYALSLMLVAAVITRQVLFWVWPPVRSADAIRDAMSRHRTFVTQLLPGALANVASFQLPVIFLTSQFGLVAGGYYTFSAITLGAPIAVFATAAGEVLRQRAAADVREGRPIGSDVWMLIWLLGFCGLCVFVVAYGFGDRVVGLIGGEKWMGASDVVQVIAPLLAIQFIGNPMGYILSVLEGHRAYLRLQISQFMLFVIVAIVCVTSGASFLSTIASIVAVQFVIYGATALIGFRLMRVRRAHAI